MQGKLRLAFFRMLLIHLLTITHSALGLAPSKTFSPLEATPFVTAAPSPSIPSVKPSSPLKVFVVFWCYEKHMYRERTKRVQNRALQKEN